MKKIILNIFYTIFFTFLFTNLHSEILKNIKVTGNKRISTETIKVYGDIQLNKDYKDEDINEIIKKLYNTNFFSNVSTSFANGTLSINVSENPIIYSVELNGEDTKKFKERILKVISLKEKSSYIENFVKSDIEIIKRFYKSLGFYSISVDAEKQKADAGENTVNLIFNIKKGDRSKIKKIYFIGDKKIKSKRLRDVITSEEAKLWKFLTRNIYLNTERIELDKRLLKNYYLGRGYYDVQVLSTSAEITDENNIELTFSINAGQRYRFKKFSTDIDPVFDLSLFADLKDVFNKYAGEYYSPFKIKKILESIDEIIDNNQLQFVQQTVKEIPDENGIDIQFKIFEGEKIQIGRVNIDGNNVTNDSVIRSALLIDEGDPFSKLRLEKSISILKAQNIFGKVDYKITDGSEPGLKDLNITIEEKPTGEVTAGAGYGTEGGAFSFAVKENNYLGKGLKVSASADVTSQSLRGGLNIVNPNYNYSGNKVYGGFSSTKTDRPSSGYENTLINFNIGTEFEQYRDIFLSPGLSLTFDDLSVDNTASDSLKKQEGSFNDLTFNYGISSDKRNRKFMPTDGHIINFRQGLPLVADTRSLTNKFRYRTYHSFSENLVTAFKVYGASVNAVGDEDVRLSKRLKLGRTYLRGFEAGKVGPKDGNDYIGGNYAAALNLEASLPNLLPESTETDISVFMDAANLWHVDYSSNVDDSNKIRSSVGIASNIYTPVGPLSFVIAQNLSKADTDETQTFNFQIGTSF
ncbi:MAG: outer membrane protein assembly factor BamA [Candidatus Marinimicrobia bacterium]|nr:outer membrane protein assembly factor BamA [Candidatus Neomarinimicrobiota bacterium]|tara:strand:- start:6508 stop:8754 length:2247 start_codon:yes stop_codon:yes gene_type:complete